MSIALQKLSEVKDSKKQMIAKDEAKAVEQNIMKKKALRKTKWVDWDETKRQTQVEEERIKRRKSIILLGYSGTNYYGMQRNPGMMTIEEQLLKAMHKIKWITEDSFEQAQNAGFQRAARTDKGVSAARQVCSLKLPDNVSIEELNEQLPEDIRLFAVRRVTKGFNAKDQCNARTYTYTLPTLALADWRDNENDDEFESYYISREQMNKLANVLEMYEGTKNFHNFTSRKHYLDPSAKRYITSFKCSLPFRSPEGMEFVTLKVKGQSFMLHQIRKMVGLTIAIVRGHTTIGTLERAFTAERLDIPMAPGLGLVLDTVHYDNYNNRYGNDGVHEPLVWDLLEDKIQSFMHEYIFCNIYRTEFEEKPMEKWLDTLFLHSYEQRTTDATDGSAVEYEGKQKLMLDRNAKHNNVDSKAMAVKPFEMKTGKPVTASKRLETIDYMESSSSPKKYKKDEISDKEIRGGGVILTQKHL